MQIKKQIRTFPDALMRFFGFIYDAISSATDTGKITPSRLRLMGSMACATILITLIVGNAFAGTDQGQRLLGLSGVDGVGMGAVMGGPLGMSLTGTGFTLLNPGTGNPKPFGTDPGYVYSATAVALDSCNNRIYMERLSSDGSIYLVAVDELRGEPRDVAILKKPFKNFVFDCEANALIGLSGSGPGGVDANGIFFSGTEFISLKYPFTEEPTVLSNTGGTFIATAQAVDPSTRQMYMERVEGDGSIHLVAIDLTSGEQKDMATLTRPFKCFVFDSMTNTLLGLHGTGSGTWLDSHGFLIFGTEFISLKYPFTEEPTVLSKTGGTFIATAQALDPNMRRMYMERVEDDGSIHLVAIDLTSGEQTDVALVSNPLRQFLLFNAPPTELTLARMSRNAYDILHPSQTDCFIYSRSDTDALLNGPYSAVVYQKGNQVVIAFRGTQLYDGSYIAIQNILADVSFNSLGAVTDEFVSQVSHATQLLYDVWSQNRSVNITLTGHSLGGAIAQILGATTKLPTVTFDAPGAYSPMQNQRIQDILVPLKGLSILYEGDGTYLRMYGDVVSRVGTPLDGWATMTVATTPVLKPCATYWASALRNHSIDLMIEQLKKGAERTPGLPDPPLGPLVTAGNGACILTKGAKLVSESLFNFSFDVSPLITFGIDPDSANEYEFVAQSDSPMFASLILPDVPGINSYGIMLFVNNTWMPSQELFPLQTLTFPEATKGFKFWALDSVGQNIQMPGHFIFDTSFSSSGTVEGILTARTPNGTVPGAPTGVTAVAGNAQATVVFTAPVSDGESPINFYTVTSSPDEITVNDTSSPITVTGLTNGTPYTFIVNVTNALGTGPDSYPSKAVTPIVSSATVPGVPTGVTAVAGNAQATVVFTAPVSDGESPINFYTVTSSPGGIKALEKQSPVTVTGLTNGTVYTFTVTATNAFGVGAVSASSNSVIPGKDGSLMVTITPQEAINRGAMWNVDGGAWQASGAIVSDLEVGMHDVAFQDVSGWITPSSQAINIIDEQTIFLTGTYEQRTQLVTASAGEHGTISPLGEVAVSYGSDQTFEVIPDPDYHVADVIVDGNSLGAMQSFAFANVTQDHTIHADFAPGTALTPPGAPTELSATAGDAQATVSFTAPVSNGGSPITYYTITSSPGSITAQGSESPIIVKGLSNGTSYTFTIMATNAVGTGPASSPSNSVIPMIAPGLVVLQPGVIQDLRSGLVWYGNMAAFVDQSFVTQIESIRQLNLNNFAGVSTWRMAMSDEVVTLLTNDYAQIMALFTPTYELGTMTVLRGHTVDPPTAGYPTAFYVQFNPNQSGKYYDVNLGGSSWTTSVWICTSELLGRTLPGAPTGVSATADDSQAVVNFTAPASNGGSPITSYIIVSDPEGRIASGTSSPITITGLTNGTSYKFTVIAINAVGVSPASSPSNSVTPQPSPPKLIALQPGVTKDTISGLIWYSDMSALYDQTYSDQISSINQLNLNNFGGISTWRLANWDETNTLLVHDSNIIKDYFKETYISGATAVLIGHTADPPVGETLSAFFIQFNPDRYGNFYDVAPAGSGLTMSAWVCSSDEPVYKAPGAPTDISATEGDRLAIVAFTPPSSDGGSPIISYLVTSYPDGITKSGTSSPITITDLTNGTSYTFTVEATNSVGPGLASSPSNSVTPVAPVQSGSLTVIISPQGAIDAGAQWNVDGGAWNDNGATISALSIGQHTVAFKDAPGWTKPNSQTVTIENGQTKTVIGTYTQVQETGSLTVTIFPQAAIDDGAQWRMVGENDWRNSGTTATDVSVGPVTVEFLEITGWTKPNSQTVTITQGETTSVSGTYTAAQQPELTITATEPIASVIGKKKGMLTITRTGDTKKGRRITYSVSGSAVPGKDFKKLSGKLTIKANSSTAKITVKPKKNTARDGQRSVVITLENGESATVSIADDI